MIFPIIDDGVKILYETDAPVLVISNCFLASSGFNEFCNKVKERGYEIKKYTEPIQLDFDALGKFRERARTGYSAESNLKADKYHVLIRDKENDRVVWRFTDKPVVKEEAEKVARENNYELNHDICYITIEKE